MPIQSIVSQPAPNVIKAAYRPIILRVLATGTPPVVYCDIYISLIYYKTISKTQSDNGQWVFDIQDALQEYLEKYIAINGIATTKEATLLTAQVYCRFRSSSIDTTGFIVPEGGIPIQATGGISAVAGGGLQSNTFIAVNATLQHEDNQELSVHLESFKKRTWDTDSYPLTHRPEFYYLCRIDSDSFPIVSSKVPAVLTLNYRLRNSAVWQSTDFTVPCNPPLFAIAPILPDGAVSVPYSYSFQLLGTAPFALGVVTKPAWMTINIVGDMVQIGGTPTVSSGATAISIGITNCGGSTVHNDSIIVTACIAVAHNGILAIPDATVDQAYFYSILLTGTQPFSVLNADKPAWLNINVINGNELTFAGTPTPVDAGNAKIVYYRLENCGGGGFNTSEVIDVVQLNGRRIIVGLTSVLSTMCTSAQLRSVYTPDGLLTSGGVVYSDGNMTVPLQGFSFIMDMAVGSNIFEIDSSTGVVFANTGITC